MYKADAILFQKWVLEKLLERSKDLGPTGLNCIFFQLFRPVREETVRGFSGPKLQTAASLTVADNFESGPEGQTLRFWFQTDGPG